MFKRIREEINAVLERDPAAHSRAEVLLCYPGFHAVLAYRLTHALWERNFKLLARFISHLARWLTGIEIHPAARIGERFFIDHGMGVVIGETSTIGNDVTLYHGVTLGGTSWQKGVRHPQIGNHVIIGSGAQLLGPIAVGDGARIGSNAVVVKDVEAGATMVGIPARRVGERHSREEGQHFDPYATTSEINDPLLKTVESLLAEVERLKKQVEGLEESGSEAASRWDVKKVL